MGSVTRPNLQRNMFENCWQIDKEEKSNADEGVFWKIFTLVIEALLTVNVLTS